MRFLPHIYNRFRFWAGRLRGFYWMLLIRLFGGKCGSHLWVGQGVIWKYAPHSGVRIGQNVQLGEYCIFDIPLGATLSILNDVKFSMGCVVAANSCIEIGSDCQFGEYVSIRDSNHGTVAGKPLRLQPLINENVTIGRDVWVGRGAAVLSGATIADEVVIGANSVVLRGQLQARGIFVGVPCRLVKKRE